MTYFHLVLPNFVDTSSFMFSFLSGNDTVDYLIDQNPYQNETYELFKFSKKLLMGDNKYH